jgi:hypothetical protein
MRIYSLLIKVLTSILLAKVGQIFFMDIHTLLNFGFGKKKKEKDVVFPINPLKEIGLKKSFIII